ncbi:PREDICTED: protein FAR1-RELATED SEQUENCE 3-like [Brassica oleracea var. oleracea]|uniref:protein FAR1-RELATED SEQUENCE 3-like n=1 Tax=Brassica oleracea var. oleracea TaxID=109376 RepID=UPI0006A6BE03|nr:PREDICTED: protein FAR1-RELATED SEQUENCE 3-like [Brassica oleracea var. oleracea]
MDIMRNLEMTQNGFQAMVVCMLYPLRHHHWIIVPVTEQQSRGEKESSYGGNYSELASGLPEVEVNPGAVTLFTHIEEAERYLAGGERVDNVVNGEGDEGGIGLDNMDIVENEGDKGGIGLDNMDSVENEGDVDNSMGVRPISDYIELPRVAKEIPVVKEREDGLGFQLLQEFPSKEAVKDIIDRASPQNCFGINIANSDKSRYVVKCRGAAEGCKWVVRATKIKNSEAFSIRTYTGMHSCSHATSFTGTKRKPTPRCVAAIVHTNYPGLYETPTAKTLVGLVQRTLGVDVSYATCWRGKQQAVADLRGSPEEGYKRLLSYLYMLEKVNPNTKTSLLLDENKRFKYLFVALGASIQGFEYMRKFITVDATFLKTVEDGVLIIATAQDPNRHHYPIAFSVVDGEKNASWNWFFTTLKTVIPDSTELVFVSDRNTSLIKAVAEVYPMSKHGYCIWHISHNVKGHVRYGRDEVAEQFRKVAQVYSEAGFEQQYQEFRERYPLCAMYLDKTVDVKKWAKCHFPGARYNIDTSNCAESLNALFEKARKMSLLPMLDTVIDKMAEWFNRHRKDAAAGPSSRKLVPLVENKMHKRTPKGEKLQVTSLNTFKLEYSVIGKDGKTYLVDLQNKT